MNETVNEASDSEFHFPHNKKNPGPWVLVATILGTSMAFIDSTAMNVVVPVLQVELDATVAGVQWVVEAYGLMLSSLMLLGGSLGDHVGRRRVFAIGVVLFTVSSIWCGLAPGLDQLITARVFQGIGGALLIPGSLAIINISYSEEERGKAIGTWSAFTAVMTSLGPVLGGWLADNISWRWVFFINVPLAAVALFVLFWCVPESRDDSEGKSLDIFGAILATLGLGGIIFGLIESSDLGFSDPKVISALIFGVFVFAFFIFHEASTYNPMLPLSLFRSKTFAGANLVSALLYAAWGGALFFIPFNFIQVQGYSPTEAGAAFLPLILLFFLISRWAGGMVDLYGAKIPLVVGPAAVALGYTLFAVPGIGGSYWTTFFPAIVVLGIGMAISVAPLTTTVMGSVNTRFSGLASGINNSVGRIAGLLSIAILGIIILQSFDNKLDSRLIDIPISKEAKKEIDEQSIKMAAIIIPPDLSKENRAEVKAAVNESFIESFRIVMTVVAGLSFIASFVSWYMIGGLRRKSGIESKGEGIG